MRRCDVKPSVLTHGLHHLRHIPCDDDPVRHMTCGEGAAGFISLHDDGRVRRYHADGRRRCDDDAPSGDSPPPARSLSFPYAGLTSTQLAGRLVGWGPGATLTLLDAELRPLVGAQEPLDVRACQAAERSLELVTAGTGNVCVWCLTHMVCRVRVTEGLGRHSVITQLALAPPAGTRSAHRAFAVYGRAVAVVDLTEGRVLEHKRDLHLRDITGLVYCPHLDLVVTASTEASIRVWAPHWELRMSFVGHNAPVTSLVCCPVSGLLLSSSLDGTLRCWSLQGADQVQCVPVPGGAPALTLGGPGTGGTFYSCSRRGVDFWAFRTLYHLHCRLGDGPVRQIVVPPCPPPYPARVLCVHGAGDVSLVAAGTGAVLTEFWAGAGLRVRCADYCLVKEILLVLTEEGAVLRASTLTNPATLLDEWRGRGQEPWRRLEGGEGGEAGCGGAPGEASCLTLYTSLADGRRALQEWRSLQEQRGQRPRPGGALSDAKNRFLVMLGQRGGCVSVLQLDSGKVQYRTPAHSGQDITSMQADPDNSYLLTAGEDKAVLVWRVFPYAQECLSLHMSLFCGQPPLRLALLGSLLALAFQEPASATYSLAQFSLASQSRTDHQPSEDHLDQITGLCVCPGLRVFASSSQDGTVRIWDEENRLLRTVELSAEPESLAYCGERGDLLLGIRGDLYTIHCTRLLPSSHDFQLPILFSEKSDPVPDLPIPRSTSHKRRAESSPVTEVDTTEEDTTRDPELDRLRARDQDLLALLRGDIKPKTKPAVTQETKREAFEQYMKIVYGERPKIEIPEEDMFDLHAALFPPKLSVLPPIPPCAPREGFFPNPSLAKKQAQTDQDQTPPVPVGFIPNSVLVGRLWPNVVVKNVITPKPWKLRDDFRPEEEVIEEEEEEIVESDEEVELDFGSPVEDIATPLKEETPPPTPTVVEEVTRTKKTLKPPPPIKRAKAKTPPRTISKKTPTPPRVRTPSPPLPEFLHQFKAEGWFAEIFPDRSTVKPSLCPEDFSMQLLGYMTTCKVTTNKQQILSALLTLRRQGELDNADQLSNGLLTSLRNSANPDMTGEEERFVSEMLNVLVCLGAENYDLILELLSLLAHNDIGLQSTVLCLLKVMGVEEADLWLGPEMEHWDSLVQDQPDPWESLREMTADWLESWTRKYKVQNREMFLKGAGLKVSPVAVLKYFCSMQREKLRASLGPPQGRRDTVLPLPQSLSSKPIHRLGETYSMSRIREPRGVVLPPLRLRPKLMESPRFLSLLLQRVTPSLFCMPDLKEPPRPRYSKYFQLERSFVDYYR